MGRLPAKKTDVSYRDVCVCVRASVFHSNTELLLFFWSSSYWMDVCVSVWYFAFKMFAQGTTRVGARVFPNKYIFVQIATITED